jgi:hypothetical protein
MNDTDEEQNPRTPYPKSSHTSRINLVFRRWRTEVNHFGLFKEFLGGITDYNSMEHQSLSTSASLTLKSTSIPISLRL